MTGCDSPATSAFPACVGSPVVAAFGVCTSTVRMAIDQVVTLWDSLDDLDRFRTSDAMRELTAAAAGLTVPPNAEMLFDLIGD